MRKLYHPAAGDPVVIGGESGVGGIAGLIAVTSDARFSGVKKALGISQNSRILVFNTEGDTDPDNFRKIVSGKQGD